MIFFWCRFFLLMFGSPSPQVVFIWGSGVAHLFLSDSYWLGGVRTFQLHAPPPWRRHHADHPGLQGIETTPQWMGCIEPACDRGELCPSLNVVQKAKPLNARVLNLHPNLIHGELPQQRPVLQTTWFYYYVPLKNSISFEGRTHLKSATDYWLFQWILLRGPLRATVSTLQNSELRVSEICFLLSQD